MHRPVAKRRTSAGSRLSTPKASAAFRAAPTSALQPMRARGDTMSGRLASAEPSVPRMKPACTAMVSPARPPSPSAHSRESAGSTAEALNQSERAPSSAAERRARARQRPGAGSGGGGWITAALLDGVAAPGQAGVEGSLGVVESLLVKVRAAEHRARSAAGDGAHGCARPHHASADSRRGAQSRAEGPAHDQSREGPGRHRASRIVVRLLLCLEPALVTVTIQRLAALALAGQDLIAGHVRHARRGEKERHRYHRGERPAGESRWEAGRARIRHGDAKSTIPEAVD